MEYFRLTTPQQNIWNLQKYYEDTAIANLCGAIIFKEKRNHTWLRQSVLLFVQNQKGLRLRFCEKDGTTGLPYLTWGTEAAYWCC